MTDDATTSSPVLAVVGASGRIGREVARLAVAYGCDVVGICRSGQPPTDEPWTKGVVWTACDATTDELSRHVEGSIAVVMATPAVIRDRARALRHNRVIELGCASEIAIADQLPSHVIHLRIPKLDPEAERGEVRPSKHGIATSHAAMAALRVAIEDDHAGIVEPGRVAHLGDAMFLQ